MLVLFFLPVLLLPIQFFFLLFFLIKAITLVSSSAGSLNWDRLTFFSPSSRLFRGFFPFGQIGQIADSLVLRNLGCFWFAIARCPSQIFLFSLLNISFQRSPRVASSYSFSSQKGLVPNLKSPQPTLFFDQGIHWARLVIMYKIL